MNAVAKITAAEPAGSIPDLVDLIRKADAKFKIADETMRGLQYSDPQFATWERIFGEADDASILLRDLFWTEMARVSGLSKDTILEMQ